MHDILTMAVSTEGMALANDSVICILQGLGFPDNVKKSFLQPC